MQRLKALRKEHGLTQGALASVMHVARTTVTMWERGDVQPGASVLKSLSDYFGVSIDYLCGHDLEFQGGLMNRIRETRKDKNVKQITLAAACGVSQCTFSNWESGRFNPDIVSLGIISDMLGVSIDYLLCRNELPVQPDQVSYDETSLSSAIRDLTRIVTLNNRLRLMRDSKCMNQQEIADYLHVQRTTYTKYETGDIPISVEYLSRLASFYGVSVDYLLGRNDLPDKLSDIEHELYGEIHDLTDEEKQDILDYVRFKRSQRKSK